MNARAYLLERYAIAEQAQLEGDILRQEDMAGLCETFLKGTDECAGLLTGALRYC